MRSWVTPLPPLIKMGCGRKRATCCVQKNRWCLEKAIATVTHTTTTVAVIEERLTILVQSDIR